jgi:hypothetical protein
MWDKGQLTITKTDWRDSQLQKVRQKSLDLLTPQTAIMLLLHILGEGFSVPSGSERGFHNLPSTPLFPCIVEPIQPAACTSDFHDIWGNRFLCNVINKLPVDTVSYRTRLIFKHSLIIHKYILLQWKQYKESFSIWNAHESCHLQLPKSSWPS